MFTPPHKLSNNNVPTDFDIFSPVFCAAIRCQCFYVNRATGQMLIYSTSVCCIFFMYIKYLFNLHFIYAFYYSTKINVPQYILNCSCN